MAEYYVKTENEGCKLILADKRVVLLTINNVSSELATGQGRNPLPTVPPPPYPTPPWRLYVDKQVTVIPRHVHITAGCHERETSAWTPRAQWSVRSVFFHRSAVDTRSAIYNTITLVGERFPPTDLISESPFSSCDNADSSMGVMYVRKVTKNITFHTCFLFSNCHFHESYFTKLMQLI